MTRLSETDTNAATIREIRGVAHKAVTEGVNLKYVEFLRRKTYELCDLADALVADRDAARADLRSLSREMTGMLGEQKPRKGVTLNDQIIAAVGEVLAERDRLAEKLTCGGVNCGKCFDCTQVNYHFTAQALERVRAERDRLAAALREIADLEGAPPPAGTIAARAREALAGVVSPPQETGDE